MQPYAHAQASAQKNGRDWQEDLPIHEFMDLAKHACPDLRHRLVLHNFDLGPALAALAFPERNEAREIALAHVRQDLGWAPTLETWLARCDPRRLPQTRPNALSGDEIVNSVVAHFGLHDANIVQPVWDMLTLPLRIAPAYPRLANALLMNSFGPILARAAFGPPRAVQRSDGRQILIDFSWVAEGMIVSHMGAINSLERVMACFDGIEPQRANSS